MSRPRERGSAIGRNGNGQSARVQMTEWCAERCGVGLVEARIKTHAYIACKILNEDPTCWGRTSRTHNDSVPVDVGG